MNKNKYDLYKTGQNGKVGFWRIGPWGIGEASESNSIISDYGEDSSSVFDEDDGDLNALPVTIKNRVYKYVPFGKDDMLPYTVRNAIMGNMITAQCISFNIESCYGQGLRFVDRSTHKDATDKDIRDFCLRNSLHECFMEQATDIKMYNFSVTVIILSRDGSKIVNVRNKDASYCRFEYAPSTKSGKIEHVFFGDFRTGHKIENRIEVIPLLDYWDPLGDLEVRMGKKPDPTTGALRKNITTDRKFAILSKMSTPGCQYYPTPYWMSIFRDSWYDIYRLIGIGKRFLIKNTSAPRVQIEIHEEYWDNVCDNEGIHDEAARKKRMEQEKQKIIDFVTGLDNAGKAMVSGYYIDPNGKENRMVRFYNLNDPSKKEGGNWSDDMQEAANAICFGLGVHPNLVGATPGKSQMNNSGSDKRELFTLKQSLEKGYHDVMGKPYHVILHYNGWADRYTVDVPMLMLTTLDQGTDAQQVSVNNSSNQDSND